MGSGVGRKRTGREHMQGSLDFFQELRKDQCDLTRGQHTSLLYTAHELRMVYTLLN